MSSADCYLSVISAFLSVKMAEMSKKEMRYSEAEREEEDVWTAIKCTTNRKCKSADAPAVVLGLTAATVKSKQHE